MSLKFQIAFFLIFLLLISGCSTVPTHNPDQQTPTKNKKYSKQLPNQENIKQALYSQHKNWKATPYKLGGNNKKGIDCSGFMRVTFLSRFGIKLPRSTEQQAKFGTRISQKELKAGDLVFFKTRPNVRHVGVYLENRRFLHASSSKGVMISNMDNQYWSGKYWKAIRL